MLWRLERDLDDELRFHLDKQIEQNLAAGMTPEEARYAALRSFGGVAQVKESCRDLRSLRGLDSLLQDLRCGVRMLRRNAALTVVAMMSLSLGIGANTAILSVVNAVLLRSLPFSQPERLVRLWERPPKAPPGGRFAVAPANFLDWREQNQVFEEMAALVLRQMILTGTDQPKRVRALLVHSNFFRLLGVQPALGRTFQPEEDGRPFGPGAAPVVILSDHLWRSHFASDPQVIGKTISIEGGAHTVVGVMPAGFRFLYTAFQPEEAELWLTDPLRNDPPTQRIVKRLMAIARLKPGVSVAQAQADMDRINRALQQAYPDSNKDWGVGVYPVADDLAHLVRSPMLFLLGAVGLVLLIACANVAGLLLSRGAARGREIAIRAVLGATRGRLVRQLLTESVLLSALGGGLGVLFARAAVPALVHLSPASIPRLDEASVDGTVLAFTLTVSVLAGVLCGLAPALYGSRANWNAALKDTGRTATPGAGRRRTQNVLIVAQVAICQVLLIGAGLLVVSYIRFQRLNLGFQPDHVLTARLSLPRYKYAEEAGIGVEAITRGMKVWNVRPQQVAFVQELLERIQAMPGVTAAGAVNFLPMTGRFWGAPLRVPGRALPPGQPFHGYPLLRPATPDLFRSLGIPLRRGRFFTDHDGPRSPAVAIVNETMARQYWPHEDPVGRRVETQDGRADPMRPFEIVGVVGDTKQDLLLKEQGFGGIVLYIPYLQQAPAYVDYNLGFRLGVSLAVRTTADPGAAAQALRAAVRELDPDQPIERLTTMEEFLSENEADCCSVKERRFQTLLLGIFASLALVLAAVGLYGTISYAVTRRTHEIGVRMALGAGRWDVVKLSGRQGLVLTAIGLAAGNAAALALTRLLRSSLYGVSPVDPPTFAAVSGLLLFIGAVAAYLPARRAALTDPLEALRYE
jgi:putative ABC transport system permease protein